MLLFKKGNKKMTVTKKSLIGDILDNEIETAQFFFEIGMHCLGCAMAHGETIEQACAVHGINSDALIGEINQYLTAK
jgi:hybrid cluster-associated redox disulfide protein